MATPKKKSRAAQLADLLPIATPDAKKSQLNFKRLTKEEVEMTERKAEVESMRRWIEARSY